MRTLLILTFLLLFVRVYSQQDPKSLIPLVQQSGPDTNRISLLYQLGSYYVLKPGNYKEDLDSGLVCFNTALQLCDILRNIHWKNKVLLMKGDCYLEGSDFKRGGECFQQVADYFHKTNNPAEEANTIGKMGRLYRLFNLYREG